MNKKRTVVIGASPNPDRYSNIATLRLLDHKIDVKPVGLRKGKIDTLYIYTDRPIFEDVHTVTLYVGPQNQDAWLDYIFKLDPKRIIFNPGTENKKMWDLAQSKGIETIEACTLVMLSIGNY